jgi:1-deoxy-D-xylulose-5-phosphate synthase
VVFALDRAGPVGQDGPTHNGVFDIAYLRTLPNMVLSAPRDATDVDRMLNLALKHDGPFAMRFPRGKVPSREEVSSQEREPMAVGRAEVLRDGEEGGVVLWAYGVMVSTALEVAQSLAERGVPVGVVDARFAKPVDEDLLARHMASYRHVVTLEDHQRAGGFGSAVLEASARIRVEGRTAAVRVLGIPDRYVDHMTTREEQLASAGLDAPAVTRVVTQLLGKVTA